MPPQFSTPNPKKWIIPPHSSRRQTQRTPQRQAQTQSSSQFAATPRFAIPNPSRRPTTPRTQTQREEQVESDDDLDLPLPLVSHAEEIEHSPILEDFPGRGSDSEFDDFRPTSTSTKRKRGDESVTRERERDVPVIRLSSSPAPEALSDEDEGMGERTREDSPTRLRPSTTIGHQARVLSPHPATPGPRFLLTRPGTSSSASGNPSTPQHARFSIPSESYARSALSGPPPRFVLPSTDQETVHLPLLFSPHRRGVKKFVSGGLADTVRDCILGVGVGVGTTAQGVEEVEVLEARRLGVLDGGGWMVSVNGGRRMILLGEGDGKFAGQRAKIKIERPMWDIDLGLEESNTWKVVTRWSVVP